MRNVEKGKKMKRKKERGEIYEEYQKRKMVRRRVEQSQKCYMVSGSLCPLISVLVVSYSVGFVVRGQRPRRGQ